MKLMNPRPLSEVQHEKKKQIERKNAIDKVPGIEENVDIVAETIGITLDDTAEIAETVGALLDLVVELQNEIELLKGGK